jgi:hypothetical protein
VAGSVPEFSGIRVTMLDGGCFNFLPGPSRPGVTVFTASVDGVWISIHAVCPAGGGYVAARFSAFAVRGYEPIP